MITPTEEKYRRLEQIEREIKTCQANAIRFFDDRDEVSIQHQLIDELLQEKAEIIQNMEQ
jgi:hypothetical protein